MISYSVFPKNAKYFMQNLRFRGCSYYLWAGPARWDEMKSILLQSKNFWYIARKSLFLSSSFMAVLRFVAVLHFLQ